MESEDFSNSGSEYLPSLEESSSELDSSNESVNELNPQPEAGPSTSKKRTVNKENWDFNKRKVLRNNGGEYTTRKGNTIGAKLFENADCGCPKKCVELFTANERQAMFDSFWKLKDFNAQNAYLYALVQKKLVSRKRPKDRSRAGKAVSFKYFLKSCNNTQAVCKKYFMKTFQVNDGRLYRCLSKDDVSQTKDKRGTTSSRQFDDSDIVAHIRSFPAYQSHYTRRSNPNRKYLNPGLTVTKMYGLYKEQCESEGAEPKKLKYYMKVFNTKFNLHFKQPRQDTCKTCDDLTLKIEGAVNEDTRNELKTQRELHQRKAEAARQSLQNDARKIDEAYVLTFDLQKALAFPKLTTSVAYYKRNMYLYNLGIHCFNNNTGYMNVWDEVEGGRGSQDIAFCLTKHLRTHAILENHIIMYSDSCTGQNRNIKTTLSLLKLVQDPDNSIKTIDHKFLVSGHSYLPSDGEFGIIENASRRHIAKTPHFRIENMKNSEFLSTAALEASVINRKKTKCGYDFSWLRIRWMRFEEDHPLQFKFKETLNPETTFYEVDLSKKTKGPQKITSLINVQQAPLYPSRRPVTAAKKRDMLDLLPYIPPVHHQYYKNLPLEITTRASTHNDDERSSDDEIMYD